MSGERARDPALTDAGLQVRLDAFAQEALGAECERLGISAQELVEFALAYYLADLDSGRIARQVPPRGGAQGATPSP